MAWSSIQSSNLKRRAEWRDETSVAAAPRIRIMQSVLRIEEKSKIAETIGFVPSHSWSTLKFESRSSRFCNLTRYARFLWRPSRGLPRIG